MSYMPCRNQNCSSYGKPHPNCKCYGALAEGGDVSFCSTARSHGRGCEYFAEGGEVEIDPTQVEMDEPAPAPEVAAEQGAEVPPDQVEIDTPESSEVPPDQVEIDQPTTDPSKPQKISDQDIAGMNKDYEEAFGVGSLITGGGAVGLAGKAAAAAAEYANLGKVGAGILNGALSNSLIQASDEASKMFLGENQEHPVAAIIASAGLGGLLGGAGAKVGSLASEKLKNIKDTKLGNAAASFLAGLGTAANRNSAQGRSRVQHALGGTHFDERAFDAGEKYFEKILGAPQKAAATIGAYEGARRGYHEDGVGGALEEGLKGGAKGFALGKALGIGTKAATPVLVKILSSQNTKGMLDALNHFEKYSNGVGHVDRALEGLFGGTAKAGTAAIEKLEPDDRRKSIEDWIDGGGITDDIQQSIYDMQSPEAAQGFAEGGDVKPVTHEENGVAIHFPEQNILMHAAKARAASYLNSLRPPEHQPKLAFDDKPDDRQQKKTYKRALDVAASPLSVLDEIRKGTIEPEHIKHLNAMFPEVTSLLQQKVAERISKAQVDKKKPNYKVRQGLSMLLGTPLSGELTPQSIQAAQAVFAKAAQPQHPNQSQPPKKNSSKLSKSDRSYLTDDQARMTRQQRTS